jgi:hypothetical protein
MDWSCWSSEIGGLVVLVHGNRWIGRVGPRDDHVGPRE